MSETEVRIEELYERGDIVLCQAIYDVDYKPIFQIRENLGYLADSLKGHYDSIEIINDKAKGNIEAIHLKKGDFTINISYKTFRVIKTYYDSNVDLEKFNIELIETKKHIDWLIEKKIFKFKSKKEKSVDIEPVRIGIRFVFAVKFEQEHIRNIQQSTFLSEQLIDTFCRKEDKIYFFTLIIAPEGQGRAGKSEKTIKISTQPVIELGGDNIDKKTELKRPVVIDYIEAFFYPDLGIRLMKESYKNVKKSILIIFQKPEAGD